MAYFFHSCRQLEIKSHKMFVNIYIWIIPKRAGKLEFKGSRIEDSLPQAAGNALAVSIQWFA